MSYKRKRFNITEIIRRSRELMEKEGLRSLLTQSVEKVTRREFTITHFSVIPQADKRADDNVSSTGQLTESGVNLVGYFTGRLGIGASARAFADILDIGDIPHVLNNLIGEHEPFSVDYSFALNNPYPVNIIHVNADMTELIFRDTKYVKGKYNIGIWYWELSKFPKHFARALGLVDEIWAPNTPWPLPPGQQLWILP